jgi:hypothetical protein
MHQMKKIYKEIVVSERKNDKKKQAQIKYQ